MATEQQERSGSRDRKGLLTFTRKHVVDTEDECLTVGESQILGCGEENRTWARRKGGVERWDVTITYQGVTAENQEAATVKVKQVIREEPIESHPDIERIKKDYEGKDNDDGTISFPPTLSAKAGGSFRTKKKGSTKNKMYGAKTYGRKSAQWTRSYMRRTEPDDILDQAGKLSKKPPGAPRAPEGKVWLYGCAESTPRGNAFEVTENATLEDEDGPATAAYGALV
jgi:hypothetical protein